MTMVQIAEYRLYPVDKDGHVHYGDQAAPNARSFALLAPAIQSA